VAREVDVVGVGADGLRAASVALAPTYTVPCGNSEARAPTSRRAAGRETALPAGSPNATTLGVG
jgi:hypothetical protein